MIACSNKTNDKRNIYNLVVLFGKRRNTCDIGDGFYIIFTTNHTNHTHTIVPHTHTSLNMIMNRMKVQRFLQNQFSPQNTKLHNIFFGLIFGYQTNLPALFLWLDHFIIAVRLARQFTLTYCHCLIVHKTHFCRHKFDLFVRTHAQYRYKKKNNTHALSFGSYRVWIIFFSFYTALSLQPVMQSIFWCCCCCCWCCYCSDYGSLS